LRAKLALVVALALGLVAAIGLRMYMLRLQEEQTKDRSSVTVLSARMPLPKGEPISDLGVLELKPVPKDLADPNHIQDYQKHRLQGMTPMINIDRGQILQWTYFIGPSDIKDEAAVKLEPGERAVTIKVDQISGVAGLILPGSRVDVIGSFSDESAKSKGGTYTRPLLYNVPVLAVDNQTNLMSLQRDRRLRQGGYSSVTLAVNPRAARLLMFAQRTGDVGLLLRKPEDTGIEEETETIDTENMNEIADALILEQRGQPEPQPEKAPDDQQQQPTLE